MDNTHFVDFHTYCETCIHRKKSGKEEPCNECLRVPARKNTARPVNWKGGVKDG